MIYPINHLPEVIPVGVQTENGVEVIGFDLKPWLDALPDMAFSVWHTRPGEKEAYPVNDHMMVGTVLYWHPDGYDTALAGGGRVEIAGVGDNQRKLSGFVATSIRATSLGATKEPGENTAPWYEAVLQAAQDVKVDVDVGESGLFLVRAVGPEEYAPTTDRTIDEIRAAVAEGKTVFAIDKEGIVYSYAGDYGEYANDEPCPKFFSYVKYSYGTLQYRGAEIRADNRLNRIGNAGMKTPAPYALNIAGKTYDGSKAVNVLPAPADTASPAYLRWNGTVYAPATVDSVKAELGGGGTVEVDATLTKANAAADAKVVGDRFISLSEEMAFKPDAYGLPMLYLTGDTTGMTKDDAVDLQYVYGERSGTASVKWQGSSSLKWPKKNYTIKFDNAFEVVEGWGAHHKYCFKANFIDSSHARNVGSGKLWGKVVKSRANVSDKLSALPNGGAIDGFPCIIMLNNKFHGLYTWNIPKDGWMYGMDNGTVQTETESLPFDTYVVHKPDDFSGVFEPTTKKTVCGIFKGSTLSGGRLRVNWDVNKLNGFSVRVFMYDGDGALAKIFCADNGVIVSPYYGKVSGELGADSWLDIGTKAQPIDVSGPFSLPIPDGFTVRLELSLVTGHFTTPDGTLTPSWSTEAEANNTWTVTWIRTGVEVSAEAYTYSAYEHGAIFGADTASEATKFKATATLSDDFDLEYVTDENNADWALTSLNRLITACMNSDGTDLDTTIAQYLDWDSAIDYYIFTCLIGGADMAGKNYLLYAFDGTKWAFGAYDMDSTFGLWWDGTKFLRENNYPTVQWYANYHKVMNLIRYYKKDAFKARYAELRAGALSEGSIAEEFANFIAGIPSSVYAADAHKWPTIPSTAANNLNQILNWYRMRCEVIDAEVEAMT